MPKTSNKNAKTATPAKASKPKKTTTTKRAKTAPAARKIALVVECAGMSPSMRMPPLIVNSVKSNTMNGRYSFKRAFSSTVQAEAKFAP